MTPEELKALNTPISNQEWQCENCKETNEGNFEICWNCEAEHLIA